MIRKLCMKDFVELEDLIDYVNKHCISQNDIQAISGTKTTIYTLIYWEMDI